MIGFLLAAWLHPFHVSFSEADYNFESGRLEVALRVHPADLEEVLRRRSGRRVDLDSEGEEVLDRLLSAYAAERFLVASAGGGRGKLEWVGHEVDLNHAWLYFENG